MSAKGKKCCSKSTDFDKNHGFRSHLLDLETKNLSWRKFSISTSEAQIVSTLPATKCTKLGPGNRYQNYL